MFQSNDDEERESTEKVEKTRGYYNERQYWSSTSNKIVEEINSNKIRDKKKNPYFLSLI
jgi:hypothetical protein